jgi:xanthine/uracil/vitamin C permease (AzgA family)
MYGLKEEGDVESNNELLNDAEFDLQAGCVAKWIDTKFQLRKNQTSVTQEVRAGLTTFLTMSYIVIVNARMVSGNGKSGYVTNIVFTGFAYNLLL